MLNGSHSSLPSSPQLVTSIISKISTYTSPVLECTDSPSTRTNAVRQNPLSSLLAPALAKVKPLLLTLHCFFPNELLLALDILDRGLVKRYTIRRDGQTDLRPDHTRSGRGLENLISLRDGIYFVRSSSSAPPRARVPAQTVYEVHIHSWNCSCPAFALAAFRDLEPIEGPDREDRHAIVNVDSQRQERGKEPGEWRFGGTLTKEHSGAPICKHILACVLGYQCPELFRGGVEEVSVDANEVAGWKAGWCD